MNSDSWNQSSISLLFPIYYSTSHLAEMPGLFCILRYLIEIQFMQLSQCLLRSLIDDALVRFAVPIHEPFPPILCELLCEVFNEYGKIYYISIYSKMILLFWFSSLCLFFFLLLLLFMSFFVIFGLVVIAMMATAQVMWLEGKRILHRLHGHWCWQRKRYRHWERIVDRKWSHSFNIYHSLLSFLLFLFDFFLEES